MSAWLKVERGAGHAGEHASTHQPAITNIKIRAIICQQPQIRAPRLEWSNIGQGSGCRPGPLSLGRLRGGSFLAIMSFERGGSAEAAKRMGGNLKTTWAVLFAT